MKISRKTQEFLINHPKIDHLFNHSILLILSGIMFLSLNILYEAFNFIIVITSILIIYELYLIYIYLRSKLYSPKIVDKNPFFLYDLNINITNDIYIYYENNYTGKEGQYNPSRDRIEINSETLRKFKKGDISEEYLESLLLHEIAHYNRKWKDIILKSISIFSLIITVLTASLLLDNIIAGSIIIALLLSGFHLLDVAIERNIEKQADKKTYKKGTLNGLLKLWNYKSGEDKIHLDYNKIIYNNYPTKQERHLWILQFENKL